MIINNKRALAHIQLVHDIQDIPGADNIQLAYVLGWSMIIKRVSLKKMINVFSLRLIVNYLLMIRDFIS